MTRDTFDTRALLRRTRLAYAGAALLAWLEGASYHLVLSETRVMFYRVTGGAVQSALGACDESGWTLSTWAPRVVPRLPATARPLERPVITASALTMPLV